MSRKFHTNKPIKYHTSRTQILHNHIWNHFQVILNHKHINIKNGLMVKKWKDVILTLLKINVLAIHTIKAKT